MIVEEDREKVTEAKTQLLLGKGLGIKSVMQLSFRKGCGGGLGGCTGSLGSRL